jgi:predicted esterase
VLGGFSQGAATALALAASLATEEAVLGGLLIQAGFAPEVFDDEIDLTAIRARRVLVQHGIDDEVVPSFMAKDLATLIGSAAEPHADIEVEILAGGHTLTAGMLDGTRRWLGAR